MLGRQHLQAGDPLGVMAERELGVDVLLERRQAQLLEAPDLGLRERLVRDVVQRAAAPLLQRRRELGRGGGELALGRQPAPALGPALEAREVERVVRDLEPVAARDGLQDVAAVAERAPQPADLHLQALHRLARRVAVPQVLDQPVRRQRLVRVQQQQGQQCTLTRAGEHDRLPVVPHLQWPEDPELHGDGASLPGRPSVVRERGRGRRVVGVLPPYSTLGR